MAKPADGAISHDIGKDSTEGTGASRKDTPADAGQPGGAVDRGRLLRFRHETVSPSGAAIVVRVRHCLESGRAVFPESGNVVRDAAGRRGFEYGYRVLPPGGGAAAFLVWALHAVGVRAGGFRNRH